MATQPVNTRFFWISLLLLILAPCASTAQGFIKKYPFFTFSNFGGGGPQRLFLPTDSSYRLTALEFPDFGVDVGLHWLDIDAQGNFVQGDTLLTPDQGSPVYGNDIFLLENGGFYRAITDTTNVVQLRRYDANGDLLWERTHTIDSVQRANLINVTANDQEEVFVRGFTWTVDSNHVQDEGYLLKYSAAGTLLWEASHPFTLTYVIPSTLIPTADGGCMFNHYGSLQPDPSASESIVRFNADGSIRWSYSPHPARLWPHFDGKVFAVDGQDNTWLFAQTVNNPGGDPILLQKLNPDGQLLSSANLNQLLGKTLSAGKLLIPLADGGQAVVLEQQIPGTTEWLGSLARLQPDGSLAWQRPLSFFSPLLAAAFADGKELADGSLLVYAYQGTELFLVKFGPDGAIYPHSLSGRVQRDTNSNCFNDSAEPPLQGWVVQASGNNLTQFATSDAGGRYAITDLENADYAVVLTPPSYLWEPCLDTVQWTFNSATPLSDTLDFSVQSLFDCPLLEIDIATPFLRRCFQNIFSVKYCNVGNDDAPQAEITVLFDPLIEVDSASLPYTQTGQQLRFDLGAVAAGDCGSFKIYTRLSCDAELGQTLCAEAHVYPDTICAMNLPGWSGAQVEVRSQCAGDSVIFQILNTGSGDMPEALDFIIVDDHVITRQGSFQLPAGGTHEETAPADGSTWRLIAEQEPGFPLGAQQPTVGVEACINTPGMNFTMGMLNMFANYTGNPFHDIDCRAVVGSWDPNDKQALPLGVDAPHFIEPNQPIDYLIRFQNTGTDTAFTVVIRDTLSPWLDPALLRPGASSHPYAWSVSGAGVLTVTFSNIALPDSNVNEPASHGFVQFRIAQRRDNPLGAIIENSAAIYFDFNEPVITGTVYHTVGKEFLPTSTKNPPPGQKQLHIFPNPAVQRSIVQLDELSQPGRRLILRDML
ncbi:MAG: hypothetical protein JNK89_11610, partial [Saprospiraceae bacterium]|nr:hypothetical protein [Saprospiraceae bacterium]